MLFGFPCPRLSCPLRTDARAWPLTEAGKNQQDLDQQPDPGLGTETPATALAALPVNLAQSQPRSRLDAGAAAAAGEDGTTVRLTGRGRGRGFDDGHGQDGGLPGSSVLRHGVRLCGGEERDASSCRPEIPVFVLVFVFVHASPRRTGKDSRRVSVLSSSASSFCLVFFAVQP